jgi:hypothetical protein
MFKVLSTYICWEKKIKCNIWMAAERGRPIYRTHGFLEVNKKHIFPTNFASTYRLSTRRPALKLVTTTVRIFNLLVPEFYI